MMNILCNSLTIVLKVKNKMAGYRMGVTLLVVSSHGHMDDWKLGHPAEPSTIVSHILCIITPGKDPN